LGNFDKRALFWAFGFFFLLRFWGLAFGLPYDGLHPTEHFSVSHSLHYLASHTLKPFNFQHPAFYQYLVSLLASALFISPEYYLVFFVLGRLIACLASFLAVVSAYFLAKKIFNSKAAGALAAFFLGVNLLAVKYAHYAVPDSLSALFVALALYFALAILEKPALKNYLLSGLFCGLAGGSKFSGFISAGFLLCAWLLARDGSGRRYQKIGLGISALVSAFLAVSFAHLIYFKEALSDFSYYLFDKGYFGPGAFKATGYFCYPFILLPDTLGLGGVTFSLLGLAFLFLRHKPKALTIFTPLIIYLIFIGQEKGGTLQNIVPLLAVFSLLFAAGFLFLAEKKVNKAVLAGVAVLILLVAAAKSVIFDYFLLQPDTRVSAESWLLKNVPQNSLVAFERYTPFDLNYMVKPAVAKKFKAEYFTPSLGLYPASFYREQGYDYVVTSSFRADSALFFCRQEGSCAGAENYVAYDQEFSLVAEFGPPPLLKFTAYTLPWGTWPHQPGVKIYKIEK
jgi:4-amino-4-deoxy-L-arabinose transferase-like glycosyltransferase